MCFTVVSKYSRLNKKYAAIFWPKQGRKSKGHMCWPFIKIPTLLLCSNIFTIRCSLNTNFIIKLFDKFWQYASIWKKLFNIFHFHSSVQTCYVCSRVYFVHFIMASWKRSVKLSSFRLFLFLNIRLFRVMIILRCLKDQWIDSNSAFRWFCFPYN